MFETVLFHGVYDEVSLTTHPAVQSNYVFLDIVR